MANAISYALNAVRRDIGKQVLDIVFGSNRKIVDNLCTPNPFVASNSVDQAIVNKVIDGFVRPDLNTYGSEEIEIPLSKTQIDQVEGHSILIHVNDDVLKGRTITNPISLDYSLYNSRATLHNTMTRGSSLSRAANRLYNIHNQTASTSIVDLELVGHNSVLASGVGYLQMNNYVLNAVVTADYYFNNLNPNSYRKFATFVVTAVKHYIYTQYDLEVSRAQLISGHEFDKFEATVSSYADSSERYREMLDDEMGKLLYANDRKRYNKYLSIISSRSG